MLDSISARLGLAQGVREPRGARASSPVAFGAPPSPFPPAGSPRRPKARHGFSLVELLVAIAIIGILLALGAGALGQAKEAARAAKCAHSLSQLGVATQLYLGDHSQTYFRERTETPEGVLWYYGFETKASRNSAEGSRSVDTTQAALFPYIPMTGGVQLCPSFPYGSALWKPKYQGANYGYGYNRLLQDRRSPSLERPSEIVVFADSGQANYFQAPASPSNPMLEEFYYIDAVEKTVHFRHSGEAQAVFADGHVARLPIYPGTRSTWLKDQIIGRFAPIGSTKYLE